MAGDGSPMVILGFGCEAALLRSSAFRREYKVQENVRHR